MHSRWKTLVVAAGVVALAGGLSSVAFAGAGHQGGRVHVIEHAVTDTLIDIGDAGDSTGDLLTFHNQVFDATNTHIVGTDQGDCIRIDPSAGTWECRWVTTLAHGSISVEGPFFDTADSTLAITGGTGSYSGARGQMVLRARNGGTEYDFLFQLED